MKNLVFAIISIVVFLYYFDYIAPGSHFVLPESIASNRTVSAIETYEFTELFEQNSPTSRLARKGYYTVFEGYIDACAICK